MITQFAMDWDIVNSKVVVYCKVGHELVCRCKTVKQLTAAIQNLGVVDDIRDVTPIWRDMYRDDLAAIFDKMIDDALKAAA
jgi:hypothetical protein